MTAPGGTGAKPFLIAFGCLAIVAVAGVVGLFYVGHRVKRAVVETARSYGVELPGSSPARASGPPAPLPKACDLFSKEEASKLLGEPVDRVEGESDSCAYYGPPGLVERLARDQAASAVNARQTPGSQVGAADMATAFDQLVNSIPAARRQAGVGGEMPLATLVLGNDGKAQMTAMGILAAGVSKMVESMDHPQTKRNDEISGLGDRALRLPKLGLNVLRGDLLVRVVPGPIPDADAKTIEIARLVLKRIP